MAEIHITGQKMLKTINSEFQEAFPYLCLTFCSMDDWKEAISKGGWIHGFDKNKRLSEVRVKKDANAGEISIHGRTLVKNLEKSFYATYGICCQVAYVGEDGHNYYTFGTYDEMSLTQLNKALEARGCKKKPNW